MWQPYCPAWHEARPSGGKDLHFHGPQRHVDDVDRTSAGASIHLTYARASTALLGHHTLWKAGGVTLVGVADDIRRSHCIETQIDDYLHREDLRGAGVGDDEYLKVIQDPREGDDPARERRDAEVHPVARDRT